MATWDGAGNFPPQQALLATLTARGCEVEVLGHASQQSAVEATGARFRLWEKAPPLDSARPGSDGIVFGELLFSKGAAADFTAAIERAAPDLLLVDCMLASVLGVARASGLPTVALGHVMYGVVQAPIFAALKEPIEASRLVLAFSYRAFDPALDPPPHVVHVGPLRPAGAACASPWRRKAPDRPLVLVSLSTSHQDQAPLLQRLCAALDGMEVEALVTTGRAVDPASLAASPNVTLIRHLDHAAVLGGTDLLITHAGHGTVMAGVTYGAPMLCLPMGRDQHMVAARVADLGLGRVLAAEADVALLRATAEALLSDVALRERSRAFARQVAGEADAERAADLLEAAARAPARP